MADEGNQVTCNQEPSSTETVRMRPEPQEGDGDGNGPCWNIPVGGCGVSKVCTDFGANGREDRYWPEGKPVTDGQNL